MRLIPIETHLLPLLFGVTLCHYSVNFLYSFVAAINFWLLPSVLQFDVN